MNIFLLDYDTRKAARYHCDKHVVKMILESTQMLCTSLIINGVDPVDVPYKPTHKKHPCVKWVSQSRKNWRWLYHLLEDLNTEYKYRYRHEKNHLSYQKVLDYDLYNRFTTESWGDMFPSFEFTLPPQCMPDKYKCDDPVEAYRKYYNEEKYQFAVWTRRKEPEWFNDFKKIKKEDLECL